MRRTVLASGLLVLVAGCGHSSSSVPAPVSALPQSSHPAAPSSACHNVDVPAAVKAALAQADGRANAVEVTGATFYGMCGTTQYAVTRMTIGPVGTSLQSAAFLGTGAYPELLVDTGTSWHVVARGATPTGCTDAATLPSALHVIWGNCPVAATPTPSATQSPSATPSQDEASCRAYYAGKVYVFAKTVTLQAGGSAVLTGAPVRVHCGGADDFQYLSEPGTTTVDLDAGTSIEVLHNTRPVPYPLAELPAYVMGGMAETDVFLLTGRKAGAVFDATAIVEEYHP